MNRLWMYLAFFVAIGFAPKHIPAQVLITGENGGKGSRAVMVTANAIFPKDYTVPVNFWAEYGYGLMNRADVFISYGNITAFGKTQHYASFGSNLGLWRREQAGVDLSFYNNVSLALNRRDQASTILLDAAAIASRPMKIGRLSLTLYGGVNCLSPVGNRANKVFTPSKAVYSGIAGIALPISKAVTFFLEYNPGSAQQSTGIGVLYVLPHTTGNTEARTLGVFPLGTKEEGD